MVATIARCTSPRTLAAEPSRPPHPLPLSRGDNTRNNRTTVCAAHHLPGIHDGTIHATGTAPHAIEWRLGVRPGAAPFLTCVGDRYRAAAAPAATVATQSPPLRDGLRSR